MCRSIPKRPGARQKCLALVSNRKTDYPFWDRLETVDCSVESRFAGSLVFYVVQPILERVRQMVAVRSSPLRAAAVRIQFGALS